MQEQDTLNKLKGVLSIEQKLSLIEETFIDDADHSPYDYGYTFKDFVNLSEVLEWAETQVIKEGTELSLAYGVVNNEVYLRYIDSQEMDNAFSIDLTDFPDSELFTKLNAVLHQDMDIHTAKDLISL